MALDVWSGFWDTVAEASRPAVRELANRFLHHKSLAEYDQLVSLEFGADSPYTAPTVQGAHELWHIHLAPGRRDPAWRRWAAGNNLPRSSDAAMIYARSAAQNDFLLIYPLNSGAHRIAEMTRDADRQFMHECARIAHLWRSDRQAFSDWVNLIP